MEENERGCASDPPLGSRSRESPSQAPCDGGWWLSWCCLSSDDGARRDGREVVDVGNAANAEPGPNGGCWAKDIVMREVGLGRLGGTGSQKRAMSVAAEEERTRAG